MFAQIMVWQRVSVEGEEDVLKGSAVSFTMPDLRGRNDDLMDAIIKENPFLANLIETRISFNERNSLIGAFASSPDPITEEQLQIFFNSFHAAEKVLKASQRSLDKEALNKFLEANRDRKSKSDNLVRDAQGIYSDPVHGGRRSYMIREELGENLYRMEMLRVGGTAFTLSPPHQSYKMTVYDENITQDNGNGDADFMITLLNFLGKKYAEGAASFFILQINTTHDVSNCAGNEGYAAQHNSADSSQAQQNLQQAIQNALSSGSTVYLVGLSGSGGSVSAGGDATTDGGTLSDSTKSNDCPSCGRAIQDGQKACSCKIARQHESAHSVSQALIAA